MYTGKSKELPLKLCKKHEPNFFSVSSIVDVGLHRTTLKIPSFFFILVDGIRASNPNEIKDSLLTRQGCQSTS